MGGYPTALSIYRAEPNFASDPFLRIATADLLRLSGNLNAARHEYESVIAMFADDARAQTGIAELHKTEGRIKEARTMYEQLVQREDIVAADLRVYQSALSHVLKLDGEFEQAFTIADTLVRENPFLAAARVQRASLLALMNRSEEAVLDLPERTIPRAFAEWREYYVRGLILLGLGRFGDALKILRTPPPSESGGLHDSSILELVSVYARLREKTVDMTEAASRLAAVPSTPDVYTRYIKLVFSYHLAAIAKDDQRMRQIWAELVPAFKSNILLFSTAKLLKRGRFGDALEHELELLIKVA
jgi:tetratricopeptide (TPR) repeat protein